MRPGEEFPLTATQAGMVINSLRAGGGMVEIEQVVCRLREPVNLELLRAAWQWIVDRHEVLRTEFRWEQRDEPSQRIAARVTAPFEVVRCEGLGSARQEQELALFLEQDRERGFSLAMAPLARFKHFVHGPEEHVLVWTFHHALLDGRSFARILREAFERYDAQRLGQNYEPAPAPSFRRHCEYVAQRESHAERVFWREQLKGLSAPTPLPIMRSRPEGAPRRRHGELATRVSQPSLSRLAALGNEGGFTLASAVQGAWALILARHTRSDDVCFGSTRAGRHSSVPGAVDMMGCLINTVPMRIRVPADAELSAWLRSIGDLNLAIRPFEQASLLAIKSWCEWPSAAPLFETLVVFERYLLDSDLRSTSAAFAARHFEVLGQTDFPLLLSACQDRDELILKLDYDPMRCTSDSVARVLNELCTVLEAMSTRPSARLCEIPLLTVEQHQELLARAGGDGPLVATTATTVVDAIHSIAVTTPERTAISGADGELTYAELWRRSTSVASTLIAAGVAPGDVVAVMLPRSPSLAVALLGVMRAAAVYLPIDPAWPSARTAVTLEDAGVKRLITSHDTLPQVPPGVDAICLRGGSQDEAPARALPALEPASVAYLIYTSGSTGRPKGVRVSHAALLSHARAIIPAFQLSPDDRCLQFTSPSFDVSLEEMLPTWMTGATLVLRSESKASAIDTFLTEMRGRAVTVLNLPSAYFTEIAAHMRETRATLPPCIRLVVVGGERASASAYATLRARHPEVRFLNAYGPTEVTITSTYCDPVEAGISADGQTELPIGKPLGATRAYVLDEFGRLAPIGVLGELFLGGPQLSLGYHGQPELTQTRFVDDPFRPGEKLYRSGDLVQRLPSGHLLFHGRVDEQVKIRGFRVEPAEIEAALRADPRVRDVAVAARPGPDGDLRLIAWIATSEAQRTCAQSIERELAARLPAFMLPSAFSYVDELPRTPSGKTDKKALIAPSDTPSVTSASAPSSDREIWIANLFADVLGQKAVGIDDSFFDLGGHSLLAVRLHSRLNGSAQAAIPLSTIFAHPTVRALARALELGGGVSVPTLVRLSPGPLHAIPFFCICGVHLYARLAQAMGGDRPVYGTFLPVEEDMLTRSGVELDVVTMAAAYIELIREQQPEGPYLLGGVSFGGILAYEMAQQLRASGEHVGLVALFDAILPRALPSPSALERVRRNLRQLTAGPQTFAEHFFNRARLRLSRLAQRLLGVTTEPATAHELNLVRDALFRRAAVAYDARILPYRGRVALFTARDGLGPQRERVDADRGWSAVLPVDALIHEVPGTHVGILDEPGVFEIARVLQAQLRWIDEPPLARESA